MRYVLDSNVAFKWAIAEEFSDVADRLRSGVLAGLHELIAPDILPIEVAHAFSKAQRRGRIDTASVKRLLAEVLATPIDFRPHLPLLGRAIDLATGARIGVYDCLYVALAEQEGSDLITADDRLGRNLPSAPIILLSSLSAGSSPGP